MTQLQLFTDSLSIEERVQAILERRRVCNCSGQDGEGWRLIYEAIAKADGGAEE